MSSLVDLVDAPFHSIKGSVVLNGMPCRNVLSIDITNALNGSIGSASISTYTNPGVEPEASVRIYQGYDGQERLVFTGLVDTIERNEATGTYTVLARDLLKKAIDTFLVQEVAFGADVVAGTYMYSTYTSNEGGQFTIHEYNSLGELHANHPETNGNYSNEGVKAEAVVQWLLRMCGLEEGSQIKVDDTNFWIGDIKPASFHLMSVYDAVQQIAELIGWYVFCDGGGTVRFKKRPRNPSGYTSWVYSSNKHNVKNAVESQTNTDLRNYVEVHGASGIRVVARAPSPYLGSTPYRGVLIGNELIDTSGIARFVAGRVLGDLNRLKHTVNLDVNGNPFLSPGQSIRVETPNIRGLYMIESLSSNMSAANGYTHTIGAAGFPGNFDVEEDPVDIEAAFVVTSVSSIGDPKIIMNLDGASSYSNRGIITSWEWEFPGSYTEPIVTSSPSVWVAYEQSVLEQGVTINLTVKDALGYSATLASGITFESIMREREMLYRHVYGAMTTYAAGSYDGGETWNIARCPAISAAASSFSLDSARPVTYALFGGSDGKIYKTSDYCVSVAPVASIGGMVTSVHIPENNARLGLAGNDQGALYSTNDFGVTWTKLAQFDGHIRHAEYGYKNFDYITVVVSDPSPPGAYVSTNGGVTWAKLTDFGPKDMQWYTAGASTPYWAHATGIEASVPEPQTIHFAENEEPFITAATVAIDDNAGIMAADRDGQLWVASSGIMVKTENLGAEGNRVRHMIRDGTVPLAIYYATRSGIHKSIDRNHTTMPLLDMSSNITAAIPDSPYYRHESPGWGEMVALGPLMTLPQAPVVGSLVIQGSSILNTVTMSGYTNAGLPVYDYSGNGIRSGFVVVAGSGVVVRDATVSGALLVHMTPAPGTTGTYKFQQAGPGYFVCTANMVKTYYGDDVPPFTENEKANLSTGICVVDFRNSSNSSARFIPKFNVIGYAPKESPDFSGSNNYSVDFVSISTAPHHRSLPYPVLFTSFKRTASHTMEVAVEMVVTSSGVMSGVSTIPTSRRSMSIANDFGWVTGTNTGGGGVSGSYHYGSFAATSSSEDGSYILAYWGGHPMSRRYWNALIQHGPEVSAKEQGIVANKYDDTENPGEWMGTTLGTKVGGKWRALIKQPGDPYFELLTDVQNGDPVVEPLTVPDALFTASSAIRGDIYAATQYELYRIASFGTGQSELLWEVPIEYRTYTNCVIKSMTSSQQWDISGRGSDALVVCVETDARTYAIYVSKDSGMTWDLVVNNLRVGSGGSYQNAWLVVSK